MSRSVLVTTTVLLHHQAPSAYAIRKILPRLTTKPSNVGFVQDFRTLKTRLRTIKRPVYFQDRTNDTSVIGEQLSALKYSENNGLGAIRVVLCSIQQYLGVIETGAQRQPRSTKARTDPQRSANRGVHENFIYNE